MKILKNPIAGLPMINIENKNVEFDNSSIVFIFKDNASFYLNLHNNDSFVEATNITVSEEMPAGFSVLGKICIGESFEKYMSPSRKNTENVSIRVIAPNVMSKAKIGNIMRYIYS